MTVKIVAIVQARLDSTRLPRKVLKEIEGKPMLYHIVNRLKRSNLITKIVVATSEESSDDPISDFCMQNGIECFRGSKDDVLDRFYQAAKKFNADGGEDVIVRITGDSPLIDPGVTDKTIQYYLDNKEKFDYVSNGNPPTFPDGLDTEVFSFRVLEEIWKLTEKKYQREHVTPFIVESEKYQKGNFSNDKDLSHLRWCVDEEKDLLFVRKVYEKLYGDGNVFTLKDILDLLNQEPELLEINNDIGRNEGFLKSLSDEGMDASLFKDYFKKGLIDGERLYLREITMADATPTYLSWLQDSDVSRYLECRHCEQSLESIKDFIKEAEENEGIVLLAIIVKEGDKHIGNVKIGPIDKHNNNAPLGIMVGEKSCWGKGYGTEAVQLAVKFAFEHKKFHKVTAGVASCNVASAKAFEKAGFELEGKLNEGCLVDGVYCDSLIYGVINDGENVGNNDCEKVEINERCLKKSNELWEKGEKLIPCGTQTASKSPDQFVQGVYPTYIQSGKGSHVFDVDGNEYIDYPCSLGVIILGHSYPRVVEAIKNQAEEGIIFSLMHPLEVEVAEILVNEIPCAEKVRFVKNGSDATSAAIRIARAYTGREKIASCGYHGWQDWYIISTEKNKGVPSVLKDYIAKFEYNNIDSLKDIFEKNKGEVAVVIMEPIMLEDPKDNFLEEVKKLAHENGALLIFDEIVTGFRFGLGGAQKYFDVIPDLASFGKCVANGMPLSMVVGKTEIMDECYNIFQSTTYGGEAVSLAAAKATLNEFKEKDVVGHLWRVGRKLQDGFKKLSIETGVKFDTVGQPPRQNIVFKDDGGYTAQEIKSLFLQETIKRGILVGNVILLNYSHSDEDIDKTLDVCRESFQIIKKGIDEGNLKELIEGKLAGEVFRKKAEE